MDQPHDTDVGDAIGQDTDTNDAIEVVGLTHFKRLMPLLHRLDDVGCERDKAGNRQLLMSDYCAAVMLYLFNPLVNSLRMLQTTLQLPQVRKKLKIKRFSLGSFSESVRVFDPQRLKEIVDELAGELKPLGKDPRLKELRQALTLVDSSILTGLSRLSSAACDTHYLTTRDGRALHGWRLHVQLNLELFAAPKVQITGASKAGACGEVHVLRHSLEADRCYVGDGGYVDQQLYEDIVQVGSSYVVRVREDTVFDVIKEELLSQEALDANVVRDAIIRLSGTTSRPMNHELRLIMIQVEPHPRRTRKRQPGSHKTQRVTDLVVIVTNLIDLPPELVALIYLYRYSVELFFRLFKQLLGLRHLLSQRREGVQIQVYCCMIACLLIQLQTGKKPNKQMMLMMNWYLLGVASEQDVINFLNRPHHTGVKLRAKAELWKKLGF